MAHQSTGLSCRRYLWISFYLRLVFQCYNLYLFYNSLTFSLTFSFIHVQYNTMRYSAALAYAKPICFSNFTYGTKGFEIKTIHWGWIRFLSQCLCTALLRGKLLQTELGSLNRHDAIILDRLLWDQHSSCRLLYGPGECAGLLLHCGTEAAAGAVAFGCIRCLNRKEMFREKRRKGKVKGKCETGNKGGKDGMKGGEETKGKGKVDRELMDKWIRRTQRGEGERSGVEERSGI